MAVRHEMLIRVLPANPAAGLSISQVVEQLGKLGYEDEYEPVRIALNALKKHGLTDYTEGLTERNQKERRWFRINVEVD